MAVEHPRDLEARLATTESQIERITKDIASLSESVSGLRDTISRSISLLSDKIGAAAVPNFSTMAAWAGVILTTIAIFGGLVGYFWMREFDRQARDVLALDVKLQREFVLIAARIDAEARNLTNQSLERNTNVLESIRLHTERLDRIQAKQDERINQDLEELRQRRLWGPLKIPEAAK
jgi:hypothetical protein